LNQNSVEQALPVTIPQKTTKSSPLFATAPVHALIQQPIDTMSPEQLRQFVSHLRTLRTSPPTFSKQLREEADSEELAEAKPKRQGSKKSKSPVKNLANDYLNL
jgi:hypothetical protein